MMRKCTCQNSTLFPGKKKPFKILGIEKKNLNITKSKCEKNRINVKSGIRKQYLPALPVFNTVDVPGRTMREEKERRRPNCKKGG